MKRILSGLLAGLVFAAALPQGAWAQLAAPRAVPVRAPLPAVAAGFVAPASVSGLSASPLAAPRLSATTLPSSALPEARPAPVAAGAAAASVIPSAQAGPAASRSRASLAAAAPALPGTTAAPTEALRGDAPVTAEEAKEAFRNAPAARRDYLRERFRELRAAFSLRAPQDLPTSAAAPSRPSVGGSGLAQAPDDGRAPEPSSVPVPSPAPARARGWLGFGTALTFFLGAIAVENIGNETQAAAMPPLLAKVFGDVSVSADLGIGSALADFAGSLLAPLVIKRLGLKSAFLWTAGARLLSGALIAGFLAVGHMTMPALMAATVFAGFVGGMNYAVEKSIPPVLLDQDRGKLERFKAARQSVIEVVATVFPIVTGTVVAAWGFLPALVAFPVSAAVAMAIVAMTLKFPSKAKALLAAPPQGTTPPNRSFWRALTHGARIVMGTPALRHAFFGYSLFFVTTPLLYWLVAPAYGIFVAGAAGAEHAALVSGFMLGLFSLGGLAASVLIMREQRRHDRLGEAEKRRALSASLVRWAKLATASLAALALMALPLPVWGALTVPALALIPFGIAQVIAKLKVESFFQSRAPADAVDDATAFMEGAAMLVQMAVLWAAKLAFTAFTGIGPFVAIAAGLVPFAALCWWVTARLAKLQDS